MKGLLFRMAEVAIDAAQSAQMNQGKGDKVKIDQDALTIIAEGLNKLRFKGVNVSCEGERDNSAALIYGQHLGNWERGPELDIVMDPVDGTQWCADGRADWVVSIAGTTRNGFAKHFPDHKYINKYFLRPDAMKVEHDMDFEEVFRGLIRQNDNYSSDLSVALLKRGRHDYIVQTLRNYKTKINFIDHCELRKCLDISRLKGDDMYCGSGGGTEAMIIAALGKASNCQVIIEENGEEIKDFVSGDAFSVMVTADLEAFITYQGETFILRRG